MPYSVDFWGFPPFEKTHPTSKAWNHVQSFECAVQVCDMHTFESSSFWTLQLLRNFFRIHECLMQCSIQLSPKVPISLVARARNLLVKFSQPSSVRVGATDQIFLAFSFSVHFFVELSVFGVLSKKVSLWGFLSVSGWFRSISLLPVKFPCGTQSTNDSQGCAFHGSRHPVGPPPLPLPWWCQPGFIP